MRSLDHSKAVRCTALVFSAIILAQAAVGRGQSVGEPGTQPDKSIKIGERLVMHSALLKEDRPYLIFLPQSYQDKVFAPKRYPVLYLLDGDWHFHSASGLVQYLGANTQI